MSAQDVALKGLGLGLAVVSHAGWWLGWQMRMSSGR
jgi:hypothetical protein